MTLLLQILQSANLIDSEKTHAIKDDYCSISELTSKLNIREIDIAKSVANYYDIGYQRLSIQCLRTNASCLDLFLQLPLAQWHVILIPAEQHCLAYIADPIALSHINTLQQQVRCKITPIICHQSDIDLGISLLKLLQLSQMTSTTYQEDTAIHMVDAILQCGILQSASDIHIEPKSNKTIIRFRIDGLLQQQATFPTSIHAAVIARLKILASLDTNEHRHPQDGRLDFKCLQNIYQCRLNTCRMISAEKAVIRIINPHQQLLSLSELGLSREQQVMVDKIQQFKQGLVLVTGPTGSGKTNTLYTLLKCLHQQDINITTIENPVEVQLPFLNQCAVQTHVNDDFNQLLRAILRQDPDIIMIGEIRDAETAMIACRAAQTGHLVLSTIHTNSCVASLQRLQQLGLSLASITNVLRMIITQRLVRVRCHVCDDQTQSSCQFCHQGYTGRRGLFEVLLINEGFRQLIFDGVTNIDDLQQAAIQQGMLPLQDMAKIYIESGITDKKEIDRVVTI